MLVGKNSKVATRAKEKKSGIGTENRDIRSPLLERSTPNNIEAEEGLLACCIFDGGQETMALCLETGLRPEYFFKPTHQILFRLLIELFDERSEIDEIILADRLQRHNLLDEVGGYSAITRLTNRIETTAHARHWLEIVREKCLLRRLIGTSTEIVDQCHNGQTSLNELLESAEEEIFKISQDRISDSARPIKESIESASGLINKLIEGRAELTGVPTGFIDLDRMTFGLHVQEMIVLAARPSLGKTSLALNIAESAVLPDGEKKASTPTLFFSLEMSADQLAFRLLCSRARVNSTSIREGFPPKGAQQSLAQAAKELKGVPLWIDDSGQLTILEMRAKARRMAAKTDLGLVVIDYLQLITGSDPRVGREQQISEISRGVKAMAKELNLPVLVLSQLNRDTEREKRRPRLSDLRESGSIEQDADVVMLLSRVDDQEEGDSATSQQVELTIAKQRNGPIGTTTLSFIPELTRFENHSGQSI